MKQIRGWIILLIIVGLLWLGLEPIERASDALLYAPWAYGWDSRGDLTVAWTAVLPNDRHLDLTLARALGTDGLPEPTDTDAALVGTAKICGQGVETAVFTLRGRSNRSGSRLRLAFSQEPVVVGDLRGAWSGETMDLSGTLLNETVTLVLHKGSVCS